MIDQEIELPDQGDNIIRTHDATCDINPKGLGYEMFTNMKRQQNVTAQICAETGETDTYGSFLERCVRTAMEMQARGITSKDFISLCTTNHLDSGVPFLAALFIGAKTASLDPSLSFEDMKLLLDQVKPKMVFVQPDCEELIQRVTNGDTDVVVFGETKTGVPFSEFLKPLAGENDFAPVEVESLYETALTHFSSGTTGFPKVICLNHYHLLVQLESASCNVTKQHVIMNFTSLYWIPCSFTILHSIRTGCIRIITKEFDVNAAWRYIERYRVTLLSLSSTHAIEMLKLGRPNDVDISSVQVAGIGGGPISANNIIAIRKLFNGTFINFAYGQTEVIMCLGHKYTPEGVAMTLQKPGSVGRPIKGFWYKIVDPETEKILGPNEPGELRLKTKLQMNGYYNIDSSYAWDADGYLKTGDICYYDDDRYFYVVDRLKEVMKFRSWHVPPAQLEDILLQHPAVDVAVVIGLPNEEDGEHPMALIKLKKDSGNVNPEELVKFLDERVDDRKRLRGGVRFITEVPYTPSGKIKRQLLKKKFVGKI